MKCRDQTEELCKIAVALFLVFNSSGSSKLLAEFESRSESLLASILLVVQSLVKAQTKERDNIDEGHQEADDKEEDQGNDYRFKVPHSHKCVYTCNRGPPIVPLLFLLTLIFF